MKRLILILTVISFQIAKAQETQDKAFFLEPLFRVYGILPFSQGDNYLAKANDSKVSAGISMSMFEYHDFRLSAGFDHIYYDVTDTDLAGNIKKSRSNAVYGIVSYEIPIAKSLTVQPYVGGGWSGINFVRPNNDDVVFLRENSRIDPQEGMHFRIGFYTDYRIDKVFSFFAGVNYVQAKYNINTAPELVTFFDHAKTVQINFGIKVGYSKKEKYLRK